MDDTLNEAGGFKGHRNFPGFCPQLSHIVQIHVLIARNLLGRFLNRLDKTRSIDLVFNIKPTDLFFNFHCVCCIRQCGKVSAIPGNSPQFPSRDFCFYRTKAAMNLRGVRSELARILQIADGQDIALLPRRHDAFIVRFLSRGWQRNGSVCLRQGGKRLGQAHTCQQDQKANRLQQVSLQTL